MPKKKELEAVKKSPAENIHDLIRSRWSPRAFENKEVSSEDLKTIFEAASWAASSFNEQPWRFLVGRKGSEAYKKIFESLVPFNQGWASSAPVLILSIARRTFTHNDTNNLFALHDTGAATAYLSLQATALGLHTHSMAGYDHDKARKAFDIPAGYDLGAVTALGYLGDPETLAEEQRQTEIAPRSRKPLGEFVYSEFEKPAVL